MVLIYLSFYLSDTPYQSLLKPHVPCNTLLISSQGNFIHYCRGFKYHLMLMSLKPTSPALLSLSFRSVFSRVNQRYSTKMFPGYYKLNLFKTKSHSSFPSHPLLKTERYCCVPCYHLMTIILTRHF